jgi:mannose-6-phosphate isomerase-like protein (cupin superfamily)
VYVGQCARTGNGAPAECTGPLTYRLATPLDPEYAVGRGNDPGSKFNKDRDTPFPTAREGIPMGYQSINLARKFDLFKEQWQPKVVAEMNDYQFKIVKLEGDFVWHDHKNTDETFIVIEGTLRIDFRDGAVHLSAGEMFVVPKGVEHKPYAEREVKLLLIEPRGVPNTGDAGGERTAEQNVWI